MSACFIKQNGCEIHACCCIGHYFIPFITASSFVPLMQNANAWPFVQKAGKRAISSIKVETFSFLHFYYQCLRVSSYPLQHLLSVFLIIAFLLEDLWWFLLMVLICIFTMTDNTEHLFMCLLGIHIFSLVKYLFKSFAHLF